MSTSERNKAVALDMVERCINAHDAAVIREFTANPRVMSFQTLALEAFPDMHVDVLWDVGEHDMVVHWARMTGTHLGPWIYAPEPTGCRVEAHALVAFRFDDAGQILDQWLGTHLVSMLEQLGGRIVHPQTLVASQSSSTSGPS